MVPRSQGCPSGCLGGQAVSPPSLVPREDGARKLAGLFGTEAGPDPDAAADKIFHYIPGTVSRRVGVSQLTVRGGGLCVTVCTCPTLAQLRVFPRQPGGVDPEGSEEVDTAPPWGAQLAESLSGERN